MNIDVKNQGVYRFDDNHLIFHINRCDYTPSEYFVKIHGLNSISSKENGYIVYDNDQFYSIDQAEVQQPIQTKTIQGKITRDCKLYVLNLIPSGEMQCDSCAKYKQNENLHVVKGEVMCLDCFKTLWKCPII